MRTAIADLGAESSYDRSGLLRLWQELDIPEGWRAELSYKGVTMTAPPSNPPVNVASPVHRALTRTLPNQFRTHQIPGVSFALAGRVFIPGLCASRSPFGAKVAPPEPFGAELETSGF
ncbi:hypothetical protein [Sciscionella marina]|uniref:hypothetical protein n=1 Tax=Sciscionella marina TaxID=508770 RepID=UPI0003679DAE|nr:hypothetical protein [Sciscionella marina]